MTGTLLALLGSSWSNVIFVDLNRPRRFVFTSAYLITSIIIWEFPAEGRPLESSLFAWWCEWPRLLTDCSKMLRSKNWVLVGSGLAGLTASAACG